MWCGLLLLKIGFWGLMMSFFFLILMINVLVRFKQKCQKSNNFRFCLSLVSPMIVNWTALRFDGLLVKQNKTSKDVTLFKSIHWKMICRSINKRNFATLQDNSLSLHEPTKFVLLQLLMDRQGVSSLTLTLSLQYYRCVSSFTTIK